MRLALISDLHFGREDPDLVPVLLASLRAAEPDRVLVAGDFVQRARAAHFRPARDFLDALAVPWMAVPGNHDIPLFNLPARLVRPRGTYRRFISPEREPSWKGEDAVILGLDTTDRWSHQRGRIEPGQIARIAAEMKAADGRLPVILAHHPFHQRPEIEKKLMRGAPAALRAWSDCPPHVVLTGHLHSFLVEPFVARRGQGRTLQVHCGTSISTRLRGEENDFAILDLAGPELRVTRMVHAGGDRFTQAERVAYHAGADGWERA